MSDSDVSQMEEIMAQPQPGDECDVCIFFKFGKCVALGETDESGDCPSFKD